MLSFRVLTSSTAAWARTGRPLLAFLLPVQLALIGLAAFAGRASFSQDAAAYILNAEHYVAGNPGMAVNGYWSPLLSWLAAPLLAAGVPDRWSLPIVNAGASLLFTVAARQLFVALRLPRTSVTLGTISAAGGAVFWWTYATPDLLGASLLILGLAFALGSGRPSRPVAAGFCFAAAYLAKAAALPTALLLLPLAAIARYRSGSATPRAAGREAATALVVMAGLALPWILLLSAVEGRPTFATSPAINHAVLSPNAVGGGHPSFAELHIPPPGRITSWENPGEMNYRPWSPLESPASLARQLSVSASNLYAIFSYLRNSDLFGLGAAGLGFVALLLVATGARRPPMRYWSPVFVGAMIAIYLPVFALAPRYYIAAYPLIIAASLTLTRWVAAASPRRSRARLDLALGCLVAFSFIGQAAAQLTIRAGSESEDSFGAARTLVEGMRRDGLPEGPVASLSDDRFLGFYIAFVLRQPFLGGGAEADLCRAARLGARYLVTGRAYDAAHRAPECAPPLSLAATVQADAERRYFVYRVRPQPPNGRR